MWWYKPEITDNLESNRVLREFFDEFWEFFFDEAIYCLYFSLITLEDIFF